MALDAGRACLSHFSADDRSTDAPGLISGRFDDKAEERDRVHPCTDRFSFTGWGRRRSRDCDDRDDSVVGGAQDAHRGLDTVGALQLHRAVVAREDDVGRPR